MPALVLFSRYVMTRLSSLWSGPPAGLSAKKLPEGGRSFALDKKPCQELLWFLLCTYLVPASIPCYLFPMARPPKTAPTPFPEIPTGERIAALRKARGLSQEALAELMGISRKQVTDYETSRTRMNDEMLARFALVLDVASDQLLGLKDIDDIQAIPSLRITRRLRELDQLPEQKRKAILKTLDDLIRANS
jgi:transcriptional regulator with XRE-family HTH domain